LLPAITFPAYQHAHEAGHCLAAIVGQLPKELVGLGVDHE
jgi:hypothetical protein